jgi:hypothetical protein
MSQLQTVIIQSTFITLLLYTFLIFLIGSCPYKSFYACISIAFILIILMWFTNKTIPYLPF